MGLGGRARRWTIGGRMGCKEAEVAPGGVEGSIGVIGGGGVECGRHPCDPMRCVDDKEQRQSEGKRDGPQTTTAELPPSPQQRSSAEEQSHKCPKEGQSDEQLQPASAEKHQQSPGSSAEHISAQQECTPEGLSKEWLQPESTEKHHQSVEPSADDLCSQHQCSPEEQSKEQLQPESAEKHHKSPASSTDQPSTQQHCSPEVQSEEKLQFSSAKEHHQSPVSPVDDPSPQQNSQQCSSPQQPQEQAKQCSSPLPADDLPSQHPKCPGHHQQSHNPAAMPPSKPQAPSVHEVQPLIQAPGAVVVIDPAVKKDDAEAPKYKSVEGRQEAPEPLISPFMRQVLAASGTVIATVSSGMTSGFSAVLLPQLSHPESNFTITIEEGSWIASTAALPMAPGCLLGGLLMERIGRRHTIILLCIPFILGWILEAAAPNVLALCMGRALTGLGVGLLGAPGMVYIGETSSPANRGFLLASVSLAVSIGVAASHLIGATLPWRTAAGVAAIVPALAALLTFLSPESPLWLASRGRAREAARVFRMLRGTSPEAEKELEALLSKDHRTAEAESSANDSWLQRWGTLLKRPSFFKPFLIMNLFFFVQQWCGVNAVTFYTVDIFKATAAGDSGATVDEYTATGAVDAARILASIFACILLRRCGRRPLAMASGIGSALSLIALAVFLMLKTPATGSANSTMANLTANNSLLDSNTTTGIFPWDVANHTLTLAEEVVEDVVDAAEFVWAWAPVVCLVLYVLFSTTGLIPLPWVMTGEVFPVAGRGLGSGVTSCVGFLAFFSVVKTAPALFSSLDMGGAFCVYGGVVLVGTLLLHFCLPETKGKTLQEIEEAFHGNKKKSKAEEADATENGMV